MTDDDHRHDLARFVAAQAPVHAAGYVRVDDAELEREQCRCRR